MKHRSWLWIGLGSAAGAALARWQMARWFAEEPDYEVEERLGALEIRHYDRIVRAETTVEAGSWDAALNEGFHRLANYIFGANRARPNSEPPSSLDGDANSPPAIHSQKIAMTSPVNVRAERHALAHLASAELEPGTESPAASFIITFTMPKERSTGSLPIPHDARVRLRSVPARRVAVLRYNGRYTARSVAEKSRALLEAVERAGLRTRGEPEFAGYDPPSTLPFLRRNEVWIELGSPTAP